MAPVGRPVEPVVPVPAVVDQNGGCWNHLWPWLRHLEALQIGGA
jgi:hypothetical protein